MNIIALYGKKNSGKDSVGRIFQVLTSSKYYDLLEPVLKGSKEKEDILNMDWDKFMVDNKNQTEDEFFSRFESYEIQRFAGSLKKCVSAITGATYKELNDNDFKKIEDPYLKTTYRKLLQDIGESLRQNINEDIWVDSLFRNLEENSKWVIVDLRYLNELEAVTDYEGLVVKIKGTKEENEDTHISETALDDLEDHNFDFVIDNSNREKGFKPLVSQVYDFVKKYNLLP